MSRDYKRSHVIKAKVSLYVALMDLDPNDYINSDADLLYELAHDPDMSRIFHRVTKMLTSFKKILAALKIITGRKDVKGL